MNHQHFFVKHGRTIKILSVYATASTYRDIFKQFAVRELGTCCVGSSGEVQVEPDRLPRRLLLLVLLIWPYSRKLNTFRFLHIEINDTSIWTCFYSLQKCFKIASCWQNYRHIEAKWRQLIITFHIGLVYLKEGVKMSKIALKHYGYLINVSIFRKNKIP